MTILTIGRTRTRRTRYMTQSACNFCYTHIHTVTQQTFKSTGTHTRERERAVSQDKETEEKVRGNKKKVFQRRSERTDRASMTDRNREWIPGSWSLVRERALHGHWSSCGRMVFRTLGCLQQRSIKALKARTALPGRIYFIHRQESRARQSTTVQYSH